MGILLLIVVGLIAGYLASIVMGTNGQQGVTGFNLYSILVATAGAAMVIWIYRQVSYRA